MDDHAFDAVSRLIGSGHSRWRVLKALASGALAYIADHRDVAKTTCSHRDRLTWTSFRIG